MDQKRSIAIYGGTFDPVHLGHIEIARSVLRLFEIRELVFVPAFHAPHKLAHAVTSPFHRYAMLALATQDDSQLVVSTYEIEAAHRRYTVETVAYFQSWFGESAKLFFIMGADSWSEITTWREWEQLLSITNHIVITRPQFEVRTDHVPESVRKRIVDLRGSGQLLSEKAKASARGTIFISDAVMKDVSATEIRRVASEDCFPDLLKLVPEPVVRYIKKYNLYKDFE